MPNRKLTVILTAPLVFTALPAEAYIGPGAGAGAIAIVLGILASIVMAFFAILWYPMKRFLKKRKVAREGATGEKSYAPESKGADGVDGS